MNNNDQKQERKRFVILILLSFLIHVALLIWWMYQPITKPEKTASKTVHIQLSAMKQAEPPQPALEEEAAKKEESQKEPKKKEEPKQDEKKEEPKEDAKKEQPKKEEPLDPMKEFHAPKHTGDEFATRNQTDKSVTELVDGGGPKKSDKVKLADSKKTQDALKEQKVKKKVEQERQEDLAKQADQQRDRDQVDQQKVIDTESSSRNLSAQEGARTTEQSDTAGALLEKSLEDQLADMDQLLGEYDLEGDAEEIESLLESDLSDQIGNVELLSDQALRKVEVTDPFSEKEAKEIQMVNRYLERMNKQIMKIWVNPYKGNRMMRGVIKVALDAQGYLVDAFVYKASGNNVLDQSVLAAIRSVKRYEVPENEIIAERYYSNLRFFYSSIEEETELMPFQQEDEE